MKTCWEILTACFFTAREHSSELCRDILEKKLNDLYLFSVPFNKKLKTNFAKTTSKKILNPCLAQISKQSHDNK